MNRRAIVLHFIVTILLALIIFIPACLFVSEFFRVSEQDQENFADFVKTLEEFSANTKEKDSFLLILDKETFIAAFRYPTIVEFHVESQESGGGTFSQERTTVVSKYLSYPPQCTTTPCICLCRDPVEGEAATRPGKRQVSYSCEQLRCVVLKDFPLSDNFGISRFADKEPRRIRIEMKKENNQIILTPRT